GVLPLWPPSASPTPPPPGLWTERAKPLSTAQSSAQALTIDGPDQPQAARP
ncbi:hypothetical protein, partial [Pseudomonas aeruginosa]|uniref:hypothetical protein n=1 Tax=Pseudomonas aeruginosa TaxID=287 RepID=UPI0039681E05